MTVTSRDDNRRRILPHLRDEAHERCEHCGRRRRSTDLANGVCRWCIAQAAADDAYDWHHDQDEP